MMVARGIDPGPDVLAEPYTPGLYLQHLPNVGADAARPSRLGAVLGILGWGAMVAGGLLAAVKCFGVS